LILSETALAMTSTLQNVRLGRHFGPLLWRGT
jgi:hypothetical protein